MKHKKKKHTNSVQICGGHGSGNCSRKDEDCWYIHSSEKIQSSSQSSPKNKQVFREAPGEMLPPDQMTQLMEIMSNLCSKVEIIEKRMKEERI
jgi:hypothetical protein